MVLDKEIEVQINFVVPKEINLAKKAAKRKKTKKDNYDSSDSFIEPFEFEYQAVDIECHLENFFVYSGQLPHSAKRALNAYNSREMKGAADFKKSDELLDSKERAGTEARCLSGGEPEQKEKAQLGDVSGESIQKSSGRVHRRKIPKHDLKICECLASLTLFELRGVGDIPSSETDEVEYYAHCLMFVQFLREYPVSVELERFHETRPDDDKVQRYTEKSTVEAKGVLDAITTDIRDMFLYTEDSLIFRGFSNDTFMDNVSKYLLSSMRMAFLHGKDVSFNKTRRNIYENLLQLFHKGCRNSSQTQNYLIKHIFYTRGIENVFEKRKGERGNISHSSMRMDDAYSERDMEKGKRQVESQ